MKCITCKKEIAPGQESKINNGQCIDCYLFIAEYNDFIIGGVDISQ